MRTKDSIQQEAVLALEQNNNGILVMATGTGKSKVAIDYIKKHYNDTLKILLVVPTEKLRDVNWSKEFEKWGVSNIWENNVERSCYVSINKLNDKHFNIVVLDEVHNITENNIKFFQQNSVGKIIGLTATYPENYLKRELLNSLDLKQVYEVTLDDAVNWGVVAPYNITIIETKLDSVFKYIDAGNKAKPFKQTELAAYNYLNNQIERLQQLDYLSPSEVKKLQMFRFKRMHLIYDLLSKTNVAKFILDYIIPKDERTIIFCGSIQQAEKINPDAFYHSKSDSSGYDRFVSGEVPRLSCVNALNEGHNLPDLDNALVVQLNSKELNIIQRMGRILRHREGHTGTVYILIVKGTVDENWAEKALKNFDPDNITRLSFSDLKMSLNEDQSTN